MLINGKTKLYGIIGDPVKHSLSPAMHNAAFTELDENSAYVPFHVKDVQTALDGVRALSIRGLSVTIPHKETVMDFLDEIDPVAKNIGAVNTIVVKYDENDRPLLCGSNTDWIGANRALEEHLNLSGKKVVLLGAGGSARAIGFGLQEAGASVVLCSRTEERGRSLAKDLKCDWVPLDKANSLSGDCLVNATSVGMSPNDDKSLISKKALENYQVVMDIIYSPLKTKMLMDAESAGCTIINGIEMLLYQGVAQFELWTGLQPPVHIMRSALMWGIRIKE